MLLFPAELPKCHIDRVAYAVAKYETNDCKTWVGRFSNCFGMRVKWEWLRFESKEASYAHFKKVWKKSYSGGCPTLRDAEKYDSKVNAQNWLNNINKSL